MLAEIQQVAIEDAARAHQRPKLERYGDSLFVVLRTAHLDPTTGGIDYGETHLFVGANYIVSIRHGRSLPYTDVRTRCEASPDLLAKGPASCSTRSWTSSWTSTFRWSTHSRTSWVRSRTTSSARPSPGRRPSRSISSSELLEVKRAVAPQVDLDNRLVRADLTLIPDAARVYFRDVYDHAIRINEMIDTIRELLTTALEANLSLISVSQNEAMKRLAAWAAIIAVPTMIAGVYGMNFKFMPELDWLWGYPVTMAVMLSACGFLYYRFKRAGWL